MKLNKYGFIIKAPGYSYGEQQSELNSSKFSSTIVTVGSIEEAIQAAHDFVEAGVQLIELCGGFGKEAAQEIVNSLDCEIPVGFVGYTDSENTKLAKIL